MVSHRAFVVVVVLALVGFLPACGGGGGGGGSTGGITLTSVEVATQPVGPQSPFGSTSGGDEVRLHGSGFSVGLSVHFGAAIGTVTRVVTGEITVVTPAHAAGLTSITITNPTGASASFTDAIRYIAPPIITELNILTGPTAGADRVPIAGGDTLELVGTRFESGATVTVDGAPVVTTFVDEAHITFKPPASATDRTVDVRLSNPEGLSSLMTGGVTYTQEFSLDRATAGFSPFRARHLFRRAAFGATPRRINEATSDGLVATVRKLLQFTNDTAVESAAQTIYGNNAPPSESLPSRLNRQWWLHLMLKNPNPLQERLAWFLHEHFATSDAGFPGSGTWFFQPHVNMYRRFSLATNDTTGDGAPGMAFNWKQLCIEVAKDRAMLDWLDGRVSRVGAPNENFARELWELFMLGEGKGYTENDIQQAARAFTGFEWWIDRNRVVLPDGRLELRYRAGRHDATNKTIFGVTGKFGYDSLAPLYWKEGADSVPANYDVDVDTDARDSDGGIVALTLRERPAEAARFICRKLCEFFLYENPHDIVVNALADELRAAGPDQWSLEPILRRILESKAMYSSRAHKSQVRNPVEFVLQFLRTANVDLHATNLITNVARVESVLRNDLGQVPLEPPDVNGWPGGTAWLSSQGMLERTNFVTYAVSFLDSFDEQIVPLLPPQGQRSPVELVDHLTDVLDVRLSGNARNKAIAYVTSAESGGTTVPFAYDQNNSEHVKMKTRGLLFLIAQYYDAHRN